MPEISQDAFESLFPAKPPATPQELRLRANSGSACSLEPLFKIIRQQNKNKCIDGVGSSTTGTDGIDLKKDIKGVSDNFMVNFKERSHSIRESSISESENGFVCYENEQAIGYKRELSHR